jgi:hypothetical protein
MMNQVILYFPFSAENGFSIKWYETSDEIKVRQIFMGGLENSLKDGEKIFVAGIKFSFAQAGPIILSSPLSATHSTAFHQ